MNGPPICPPNTAINEENHSESIESEQSDDVKDKIQARTISQHFLIMSNEKKINLLTKMFFEMSLGTLSTILNLFFAVNTKLIFYSKITSDSNSAYDQFIFDHDRMLDESVLEETLKEDVEWFRNLNDIKQLNIITDLLRLSGGNIINKMYWRLVKIFNGRQTKKFNEFTNEYTSYTSLNFARDIDGLPVTFKEYKSKCSMQDEETIYNPNCPHNKKVIEGRKLFEQVLTKIKKEIESDIDKLNGQVLPKLKEKPSKQKNEDRKNSIKNEKKSKKNKISTTNEDEIDWIQLLPIWSVKKIFSYLDEKTLNNFKNVNNYWYVVSKEVLAEKKGRQALDAMIKKYKENFDESTDLSEEKNRLQLQETKIKTESEIFRKTMEKLRKIGTIRRTFPQDPNILHDKSIISDCFQLFDPENIGFMSSLKPFPIGIPVKLKFEETDSSEESAYMKTKLDDTASKTEKAQSEIDSNLSLVPSIVVDEIDLEKW